MVCDPDSQPIFNEASYSRLTSAIFRSRPMDSEPRCLQTVEFIGSRFRPTFYGTLLTCINDGYLNNITSLTFANCGL
jgi:hypothetical protein